VSLPPPRTAIRPVSPSGPRTVAKVLKDGWLRKKTNGRWIKHFCMLLSCGELHFMGDEYDGDAEHNKPLEIVDLDVIACVATAPRNNTSPPMSPTIEPHAVLELKVAGREGESHLLAFDTLTVMSEWESMLIELVTK